MPKFSADLEKISIYHIYMCVYIYIYIEREREHKCVKMLTVGESWRRI